MEFSLVVESVNNDLPNVITLKGDADVRIELPLELLGIKLSPGDGVRLVIQKEKDPDYKSKFRVYAWGVVYHVNSSMTRISIGGLQLDIMRELPLRIGEKVYIGIA